MSKGIIRVIYYFLSLIFIKLHAATLVIAHRGYSSFYPENTLLAIRAAVDSGAQGVEIDIHLTHDRQLILQHDETLDRMTTGSGRVEDHPWHGYIDGLKTKGSDTAEPIALLSQVFDYLMSPAVPSGFVLVLDVKDDQSLSVLDELKGLLENYSDYSKKLRVYLGVWRDDFAQHARSLFDNTGPLLTLIAEDCPVEKIPLYDAFNLDVDRITEEIVKTAASLGKDVLLWTCNSTEQVAKAKKLAVQGILTDDPLSV